ncbi:cytochrome c biogenesis heme-transporting ATPase CcmA [Photorhabdus sp. RM71S]|uniref:cytochrome c biogenesis heme-transporting ATPase CcmA n=1 Tax=Photorhabdus sp. RM71S TaxID=3342824 RepID=UPI0036D7DA72
MLEAKNLSYIGDERSLFVGLNFTVTPGDIIQVEGPNGAGKTSLLRILAGLIRPDTGEVRWQDKNILSHYKHYYHNLLFIGYQPGIKTVLTPYENLKFYQSLKQQKDNQAIWQALEQVSLIGYENLPVAQLSTGQQRRVALARLWLSHCPLWILDEPLTAIDKKGATKLITLFKQHTQQGGMILLTTHQYMAEITPSVKKIHLVGQEVI